MSEYQYYEFLALDRPLDAEQQARVQALSRRAAVTPSQAIFTYSFGGDLRGGGPIAVLTEYFDALFYIANWGTTQLAFRLPRAAIDLDQLTPYYYGVDEIEVTTTPSHVVLSITAEEEGGYGWTEGGGHLAPLVPLREDLLRGDLRCLYLAWLGAMATAGGLANGAPASDDDDDDSEDDDWSDEDEDEDDDEDGEEETEPRLDAWVEPPVPPGLGSLSAPLRAFVNAFGIDDDLIAAAATASPPLDQAVEPWAEWVSRLPDGERVAYLTRLARGEPAVGPELRRRLRGLGEPSGGSMTPGPRRTAAVLLAAAQVVRDERLERQRQAAKAGRQRRLAEVAATEPALWAEVGALIDRKTPAAYDQAMPLLTDLRDLARQRGQEAAFADRIATLRGLAVRRPALRERLARLGLA